jgi:hypothetical protein
VTETAFAASAFLEGGNGFKLRAEDGHENHLGDAVPGLDGKGVVSPIPARHEYLSLVIRVD